MPGVFILVTFPALLLATVFVILSFGVTGGAAIAMVLLAALVGVVFVSLVVTMLHQHPSQDGGDPLNWEDRFAPVEESLEQGAVPELVADDDRVRRGSLDRWNDDGGQRSVGDPR
jgi:hypothetical protein